MNAQERRWAAIGEAVERACRDLPEGADLHLEMENGAATVRLYVPEDDGPGLHEWEGDTLAAQINIAVTYATQLAEAQP